MPGVAAGRIFGGRRPRPGRRARRARQARPRARRGAARGARPDPELSGARRPAGRETFPTSVWPQVCSTATVRPAAAGRYLHDRGRKRARSCLLIRPPGAARGARPWPCGRPGGAKSPPWAPEAPPSASRRAAVRVTLSPAGPAPEQSGIHRWFRSGVKPRTRGDAPPTMAVVELPRPRPGGAHSQSRRRRHSGEQGTPRPRGDVPIRRGSEKTGRRSPRTSGDEPVVRQCLSQALECAPRARGCTGDLAADVPGLRLCPAEAGIHQADAAAHREVSR